MADTDPGPPPSLFLQALCHHVRTPLATADRVLERERRETTAERDAFEAFTERLATIEAGSATTVHSHATAAAGRPAAADQMQRVRVAYRETVMSVPHYGEVYGESLAANVAAEFGRDLATGVRADEPIPLTQPCKNALRAAAAQATRERRTFLALLDREAESVTSASGELTEMLDNLDTTAVPEWHREAFADRLDRIAHDRQELIRTPRSLPNDDGHSLCDYLYRNEPWTYPVLTAVTRLREAVVLD